VPLSDALIMAYADGELDGMLARRVEDAIQADAEARRKYESFRQIRALVRDVFSVISDEPVPDRLVRTILDPAPPGQET